MLIPLIMPVDVPLWMLAVSVVFAVVIGKEVLEYGNEYFKSALTAKTFLFLLTHPTCQEIKFGYMVLQ